MSYWEIVALSAIAALLVFVAGAMFGWAFSLRQNKDADKVEALKLRATQALEAYNAFQNTPRLERIDWWRTDRAMETLGKELERAKTH